jgi:hypothetical protein
LSEQREALAKKDQELEQLRNDLEDAKQSDDKAKLNEEHHLRALPSLKG